MKFRKKPIVIDAVQCIEGNDTDLLKFFDDYAVKFEVVGRYTFVIHTLEGDMTASEGDWLIRGVAGEVYPCKQDIFIATYEKEKEKVK